MRSRRGGGVERASAPLHSRHLAQRSLAVRTPPRPGSIWIVASLVLAAFAPHALAQIAPTADQVKAAYLQKFTGYVDWPPKALADAASPFVIGIVGADTVLAELARLVPGRPAQGRAVEVRRLPAAAPASDVHVVFIGREVGAEATVALLAAYRGRPVLTVTDRPGGLESGAVLNFVELDHRVRFEAAPALAELDGLRLSSRLLAVAQRVSGGLP